MKEIIQRKYKIKKKSEVIILNRVGIIYNNL